jgi:hypothetical protein
MRQTDSLSFVVGYYKYGMNFFEPKGLNLLSIEGKGVSEFPILYYITACLYSVFGEHEFILRLINITIVSIGFYFLFKLIKTLLNDLFYSFVLTFLFLSSTVLVYYTNNFLSDVSALGFVLVGWYYFYKYLGIKTWKNLFLSFLFFSIASLLKVTFFMNPIAAFLTLMFFSFKDQFRDLKLLLKVFCFSILICFSWVIFVVWYNQKFDNVYFTTTIRPIWNLSLNAIYVIWDYVVNYWYTKYYFQSTFHLMFLLVLSGVFFVKRIAKQVLIPAILLFVGSLCFIVLFFEMFKDHDYYFITVLPAIIFLVLAGFQGLQTKHPKLMNHFSLRLIFLSICILSINYSQEKLAGRYSQSENDFSSRFTNINYGIEKFEIDDFSKIVVVEDATRSGSLYFLSRQGWTVQDGSVLNNFVLERLKKRGAKFLVTIDNSSLIISPDLLKEIGVVDSLTFYKLKDIN